MESYRRAWRAQTTHLGDTPQRMAAVLAALMLAQAGLGLIFPGQYRDVAWIRATWLGNDLVTLVIAVPSIFIALVRARRGLVRWRILLLGLLGYALYNYAFYLLGAALNAFFPLYIGLFLLAAGALGLSIRDCDVNALAECFRPTAPVKIVGRFFVLVSLVLASVWLTLWAAYAFAGRPTPVEPEAFKLVAALDLTIMVPALATGGALLWRRRPLGYLLAPIAGIQAALYLLVLSVNSAVAIGRGLVPPPGELPVWGTMLALTAAATGILLVNARDAVAD